MKTPDGSGINSVPVHELGSGDVIRFANFADLGKFEDQIAANIEPNMSEEAAGTWAARTAIKQLMRPERFDGRLFNGSLLNPELRVVSDAYQRLLTVRDRGHQLNGSIRPKTLVLSDEARVELAEKYKGFIFSADLHSSGRGVVDKVVAEVWYAPAAIERRKGKRVRTSRYGAAVRRITTKPVADKTILESVEIGSRIAAYHAEQQALLLGEIPTPFRN